MSDSKKEQPFGKGVRSKTSEKKYHLPTTPSSLNNSTLDAFEKRIPKIQDSIDRMFTQPRAEDHAPDFLHFCMDCEVATVNLLADKKTPPPANEYGDIQTAIDDMQQQPKLTKPSFFIDLLNLSSLLVSLINTRWPSLPLASAEVMPVEKSHHKLVERESMVIPAQLNPKMTAIPDVYYLDYPPPFGTKSDEEKQLLLNITAGNLTAVKSLLNNPDILQRIDVPDDRGYPLITLAVAARKLEITKELIKANAKIDAQTIFGDTALTLVAQAPTPEFLQLLLYNGANMAHKNKDGLTAKDLINDVIEKSSNLPRALSLTLEWAKQSRLFLIAYDVYYIYLDRIYRRKSDEKVLKSFSTLTPVDLKWVLMQSFAGSSHLFPAIQFNRLNIIKQLVDWGADINLDAELVMGERFTPLQLAISTRNYDITKFLLIQGANPNLTYDEKSYPIIIAMGARFNRMHYDSDMIDIIEELLARPVNLNITSPDTLKNMGDLNLLDWAFAKNDVSLAEKLIAKGLQPTLMSFIAAMEHNRTDAVEYLVESKLVNITETFSHGPFKGYTPAEYAEFNHFHSSHKILVAASAAIKKESPQKDRAEDKDKEQTTFYGLTPIQALLAGITILSVVGGQILYNYHRTRKKPYPPAQNNTKPNEKKENKQASHDESSAKSDLKKEKNERLAKEKAAKILAQNKTAAKQYFKQLQAEPTRKKFQHFVKENPELQSAKNLEPALNALLDSDKKIQQKSEALLNKDFSGFYPEFDQYRQKTKKTLAELEVQYNAALHEIAISKAIDALKKHYQEKLKQIFPELSESKAIITTKKLPINNIIINLSNPTRLPLSREATIEAENKKTNLVAIKRDLQTLEMQISNLTKSNTLDAVNQLNDKVTNIEVACIKESIANANAFTKIYELPQIQPPEIKAAPAAIFMDQTEQAFTSSAQQNDPLDCKEVTRSTKKSKTKEKQITAAKQTSSPAPLTDKGAPKKIKQKPQGSKQFNLEQDSKQSNFLEQESKHFDFQKKVRRLKNVLEAAVGVITSVEPILTGNKGDYFESHSYVCRYAMLGLMLYINKDLYNVLGPNRIGKQCIIMHHNLTHQPGLIDGISTPHEVAVAFQLFFNQLKTFNSSSIVDPENGEVFTDLSKNPLLAKLLVKQPKDKKMRIQSEEEAAFPHMRVGCEAMIEEAQAIYPMTPELAVIHQQARNYYKGRTNDYKHIEKELFREYGISQNQDRKQGNQMRHTEGSSTGLPYIERVQEVFLKLAEADTDRKARQPATTTAPHPSTAPTSFASLLTVVRGRGDGPFNPTPHPASETPSETAASEADTILEPS